MVRTKWSPALVTMLIVVVLLGACGRGGATEEDPEVQATLDAMAARVQDDADTMTPLVLSEVPDAAEVVATGFLRSCTPGVHDWKRNDPFDLSCRVGQSVVVAVPTASTFRGDMAALDQSLQDAGLSGRRSPQVESRGLDHLADHYFDRIGGARSAGGEGEAVPYGPQHLPPATYFSDDVDLTISFIGPDDGFVHDRDFRYQDPSGASVDRDDLPDVIAGHEYALVVSMQRAETW